MALCWSASVPVAPGGGFLSLLSKPMPRSRLCRWRRTSCWTRCHASAGRTLARGKPCVHGWRQPAAAAAATARGRPRRSRFWPARRQCSRSSRETLAGRLLRQQRLGSLRLCFSPSFNVSASSLRASIPAFSSLLPFSPPFNAILFCATMRQAGAGIRQAAAFSPSQHMLTSMPCAADAFLSTARRASLCCPPSISPPAPCSMVWYQRQTACTSAG